MTHAWKIGGRRRFCVVVVGVGLLLPSSASPSSAAPSTPPGRNGLIAFAVNDGGRSGIGVIRSDGSGFRVLTRGAGDRSPAWSPGGRRLVFVRGGDLYVVDVDGASVRRLTRGRAVDADPAWSPDGRRIAFARDGRLYLINANGSSARRLTSEATVIEGVSWSPDGRMIAFGTTDADDRGWIEVIDRGGGETWSPLEGDLDDRDPDWSPDGLWLVFARTTWSCGGCDSPEIWLSRTDGTGLRRLGAGTNPSFSPDGRRVVVSSASGHGLSVLDLAGRSRALPGTRTASDSAWQPVPR
jgi:Tol biopolymer transport system component